MSGREQMPFQEGDIVVAAGTPTGLGTKGVVLEPLSEDLYSVVWVDGAPGWWPSRFNTEAGCDLELKERPA